MTSCAGANVLFPPFVLACGTCLCGKTCRTAFENGQTRDKKNDQLLRNRLALSYPFSDLVQNVFNLVQSQLALGNTWFVLIDSANVERLNDVRPVTQDIMTRAREVSAFFEFRFRPLSPLPPQKIPRRWVRLAKTWSKSDT